MPLPDGLVIQRTRSLDEPLMESGGSGGGGGSGSGRRHHNKRLSFLDELQDGDDDDDNFNDIEEPASALHSSFDASLLRGSGSSRGVVTALFADNCRDHEDDEPDICDLSGRKHYLRPRTPVESSPEGTTQQPPRTVRKKQARAVTAGAATANLQNTSSSNQNNSQILLSRTPGRPRQRRLSTTPKLLKGNTAISSSASKRRRAPTAYQPRQSPMRRVPPNTPMASFLASSPAFFPTTAIPPSTTQPLFASTVAAATAEKKAAAPSEPRFSLSQHQTFSSTTKTPVAYSNSKPPFGTAKTAPLTGSLYKTQDKCAGTGTTAVGTSQHEATFETEEADSLDTSSPARFRFTSFPASLPRVNSIRSSHHHNGKNDGVYPDSVRKHMTFADVAEESATDVLAASNNSSETNLSRDDEGTHNTSISSLSAEGGGGGHHQHLPEIPGHFLSSSNRHPYHLKLFPEEETVDGKPFGYSDDEDEDIGRTRLVFNDGEEDAGDEDCNGNQSDRDAASKDAPWHPPRPTRPPLDMNLDLSRPYDNQRRISSFPSSLSSNTQMNLSDELGPPLSPPRRAGGTGGASDCLGLGAEPTTPREVQVHFPLEAECSPIPNRNEHRVDSQIRPAMVEAAVLTSDRQENSSASSSALAGDQLLPPLKSSASNTGSSSGDLRKGPSSKKDAESLGSDSTQQRRIRPMPDVSAFESFAANSRDRSGDESTHDSRGAGSAQRLLCPPTPQRTPAWAHKGRGKHAFFSTRSNSLITTKVLLACPSQVVEGRSSLENSVLDDDRCKVGSQPFAPLKRVEKLPTSDDMDVDEEDATLQPDTDNAVPPIYRSTGDNGPLKMQISGPPELMRRLPSPLPEDGPTISFATDFEILGLLGSGAFADVYKVRAISDNRLYAVKRNRRQFRGKRDREMALVEVQVMQRLQSSFADAGAPKASLEKSSYLLHLLFFYRAWQEGGYFYSQTELCCRDTCREMLDSLRLTWGTAKSRYPSLLRNLPGPRHEEVDCGRSVPTETVWKICHDISAGLSHIHSHGIVHQDIKPSNIFFVPNVRFGAMCKIGDFGMAGDVNTVSDGQEGDARYMSPELLASAVRHASTDVFSLGLTLFEIAADGHVEMPSEGPRWHLLRSNSEPRLPPARGTDLEVLIQSMTNPKETSRPTADEILKKVNVKAAAHAMDTFLKDYIQDVEEFDRKEEERRAREQNEEQTPRNGRQSVAGVRSPSLSMLLPVPPNLFSPAATAK